MKKNECKNLYFPTLLLMYICLNGQFTFNIYYFFLDFPTVMKQKRLYYFKNCRYNSGEKKMNFSLIQNFLQICVFCDFI